MIAGRAESFGKRTVTAQRVAVGAGATVDDPRRAADARACGRSARPTTRSTPGDRARRRRKPSIAAQS